MSKRASLLIVVVLTLLNLVLVMPKPALASTPSVTAPEFSLKIIDNSYDVPITYSIDEYTGENITNPGYHVDDRHVEVRVTNPYLVPSVNGEKYYYYYEIRVKGHFGENWKELFDYGDYPGECPPVSNSNYTVIECWVDYSWGAQVDFQVEVVVAHDSQVLHVEHPLLSSDPGLYSEDVIAVLGTSDWSKTQTVTFEAPAPTETPKTEPTSDQENHQPEQTFPMLLIVAVSIAIAVIAVVASLVYVKKHSKSSC